MQCVYSFVGPSPAWRSCWRRGPWRGPTTRRRSPSTSCPRPCWTRPRSSTPTPSWSAAEKETENGKTVYEIKIKDKDQKLEVSFTPEGTLTEIEKTIDVKALPKEVTDALDAKYPKATLEKAEEVTAGDKVTYEVRLTTAEKKKLEVELDAKGKVLEEEDKSKEKD